MNTCYVTSIFSFDTPLGFESGTSHTLNPWSPIPDHAPVTMPGQRCRTHRPIGRWWRIVPTFLHVILWASVEFWLGKRRSENTEWQLKIINLKVLCRGPKMTYHELESLHKRLIRTFYPKLTKTRLTCNNRESSVRCVHCILMRLPCLNSPYCYFWWCIFFVFWQTVTKRVIHSENPNFLKNKVNIVFSY